MREHVLVLVVVLTAMVFGAGAPAWAWQAASEGTPGALVEIPYAQVTTSCAPSGGSGCIRYTHITTPTGPTVGRSRGASGRQGVVLRYVVQYRGNEATAWAEHYRKEFTATIESNQSQVRLQPLPFEYRNRMPNGDYRLIMFIVWAGQVPGQYPSGGWQELGKVVIGPSHQNDHRCETGRTRACQPFSGFLQLG